MSSQTHQKYSVTQLFKQQVVITFVLVAILIVLGALLVFVLSGEDYTQFTAVGFIATVYFSFIVFLPAGTLFGARAEFAKGTVAVEPSERTGATEPIANPWLSTVPLGLLSAAVLTGIVCALVYGLNWKPSPVVTTLVSMLFVIPYVLIVRRDIFRDIEGLAAIHPLQGKHVASKNLHIWATYIIPNIIFQAIINLALANRSFSHAAGLIADRVGPGMVPMQALVPDFAITFMFVCSFTFLGAIAHTASDMYEGEFSYGGRGRGINGLVYFGLLLLMGVGLGIVVAAAATAFKIAVVPFAVAMLLKFLVVCLSVYAACWLAIGWTGKRFNEAVQKSAQKAAQKAAA